jgi:hypothetical protein
LTAAEQSRILQWDGSPLSRGVIRGLPKAIAAVRLLLNDSMARVERCCMARKQTFIAREKENREVWTVEGLVHPGLKRTSSVSRRGAPQMELQYEYPD